MKQLIFLLATAIAWGQQKPPALPGPPAPAASDPVVVTIGTQTLTQSQFEQILATLPAQTKSTAQTPAGRRQLAEQLAELMMMAQEAKAHKLDQDRDVQIRVMLMTNQTLANAEYQLLGKPDDALLRAYYEAHKSEMDEIHARHILIRFKGSKVPLRLNEKDLTEEEALAKAQEIRAKIVAGAKFEEVAKAESDDVGSGDNGGDLDPFIKGKMVPQFEAAAFALPIGQLSEPVKSDFGYHLILVESRRSKSFAEATPELLRQAAIPPGLQIVVDGAVTGSVGGPDQAKKGLEELKKKTPVVYNETYFTK
jgi:peptidyl-prolyl cis-trans isomerase C